PRPSPPASPPSPTPTSPSSRTQRAAGRRRSGAKCTTSVRGPIPTPPCGATQLHYFGPWDDPDGALAKYLEQKDALHAGRKPRAATEGVTVKDLANCFLNAKQALVDAGELSPRTWAEYKATTDLLVANFGKQRLAADLDPDDFAKLRNKMAAKWRPHRLG